MKKFNLILFITISGIVFFSNKINAQTLFQKMFSDLHSCIGYSVISDNSGFLITGTTSGTGLGNKDVLLLKTDLNGGVTWSKVFGGTGNDIAYCVKKTTDNGYLIVGSTSSFVNSGSDISNILIIKTNSSGTISWSRSIGTINNEKAFEFVETYDHKFTITGISKSNNTGDEDILVLQIDSAGTMLWSETIGGTGNDNANGIIQTSDHGFFVVGSTTGFFAGGTIPYLIKINETGALQYSSTFTFSSSVNSQKRYFTKIIDGYQNDFLITGSDGLGTIRDAQTFIMSLSQNNTVNWMKKYFMNSGEGVGNSIAKSNNGGIIVGGIMGIDRLSLISTDATGTLLGTMFYPDLSTSFNGKGFDVKPTISNGFIFVGYRYGTGDTSMALIKTDHNMNSGCQEQSGFLNSSENISANIINQTSTFTIISDSVIINPILSSTFNPSVTTLCLINSEENISLQTENISVSQNKQSVIFNLTNTTNSIKQIIIYNTLGKSVTMINSDDNYAEIKLKKSGIYLYKIITNTEKVFTGKIIYQE